MTHEAQKRQARQNASRSVALGRKAAVQQMEEFPTIMVPLRACYLLAQISSLLINLMWVGITLDAFMQVWLQTDGIENWRVWVVSKS